MAATVHLQSYLSELFHCDRRHPDDEKDKDRGDAMTQVREKSIAEQPQEDHLAYLPKIEQLQNKLSGKVFLGPLNQTNGSMLWQNCVSRKL